MGEDDMMDLTSQITKTVSHWTDVPGVIGAGLGRIADGTTSRLNHQYTIVVFIGLETSLNDIREQLPQSIVISIGHNQQITLPVRFERSGEFIG